MGWGGVCGSRARWGDLAVCMGELVGGGGGRGMGWMRHGSSERKGSQRVDARGFKRKVTRHCRLCWALHLVLRACYGAFLLHSAHP